MRVIWWSMISIVVMVNGWFAWAEAGRAWIYRSVEHRDTSARGFVSRTCYRSGQPDKKYLIFVPHLPPPISSGKYPVVLFLNGVGENGDDGFSQITNNFGRPIWEFQETFPFLAVMPQCPPKRHWEDASETEMMLQVLGEVLKEYPADAERVYLTGASAGGAAAMELAANHPERFAAVFPVSASCSDPTNTAKAYREHGMPVWQFYNQGDDAGLVQGCREFEQMLLSQGCEYRSTAYQRAEHNAWDFAYRDPALYQWLLSHRRLQADATLGAQTVVDQPVALLDKGVIEFEATFESPVEIRLGRDIVFQLASLNDGFEAEAANDVQAIAQSKPCAGTLLSRASIRQGNWNHVEISRRGSEVHVAINGWPCRAALVDGEHDGKLYVAITSPRESDEGLNRKRANGIRSLRFRDGLTSDVVGSASPFFGGEFEPQKSVASGAVIQAEPISLSVDDVILGLKNRAVGASKESLNWTTRPRWTPSRVQASVRLSEGAVSFSSSRFRYDAGMSTPDSYRQLSRDQDYLRALARRFTGVEPVVFPAMRFERKVTADRWTETWYRDGESIAVDNDFVYRNPVAWARLMRDQDIAGQLDTLHLQAATMALGGLDQANIGVDFERLELLDRREIVGGFECLLLREKTEQGDCERRFWIDPANDFALRRYQGKVNIRDQDFVFERSSALPLMPGNVFIEIDYEDGTRNPLGWTIVCGQTPQAPMIWYEQAVVDK